MRRRNVAPLVIVLAAVIGAGIAFLATGPVLTGHARELLLAIGGLVFLLAALGSLEVAMIGLLAIAYVDGFLKGLIVSTITVFWLGLTRQRWEALRLPVILPAFLFIIYCVAQMFNTETASLLVALAGLRSWVIWIPVLIVAYEYMTTQAHIERMLLAVVVLSIYTLSVPDLAFTIVSLGVAVCVPSRHLLHQEPWGTRCRFRPYSVSARCYTCAGR